MSIEEPTIVQAVQQRLQQLLRQARQIKETTDIVPALAASEIVPQLQSLSQPDPDEPPTSSALYVETAARDVLYALVDTHSIESSEFVDVWNLLDILLYCQETQPPQCDSSLPLWLIEELLDTQTINGCAKVFDYLESRMRRLVPFGSKAGDPKTLVLMRSCNALLKRLSNAEDAIFCGRVLMFLFKAFPLGSKGLVNLRGEFNTDNVTVWDEAPAESVKMDVEEEGDESKMDVDGPETLQVEATDQGENRAKSDQSSRATSENTSKMISGSSSVKPTEIKETDFDKTELETRRFYPIFWSLQRYFSNPPKNFDPAEFSNFKHGLELTLKKFKMVRTTVQAVSAPDEEAESRVLKRNRPDNEDEEEDETAVPAAFASAFNPKYLTSYDLFELELSDRSFQRHILAQSLILLCFLLSLTANAKVKLLIDVPKAQKSVLYQCELSKDDEEWCQKTVSRITSPEFLCSDREGQYFNRAISAVLSRDAHWTRWKAESCPRFEQSPTVASVLESAAGAARGSTRFKKPRLTTMGAVEVSFLVEKTAGDRATYLPSIAQDSESIDEGEDGPLAHGPGVKQLLEGIEDNDFDLSLLGPKIATAENEVENASGGARNTAAESLLGLLLQRRADVEHRSCKTWRALRVTARERVGMLGKVEEDKDLSRLIEDPAPEDVRAESGADAGQEDQEMKEEGEAEEEIVPGDNGGEDDGGHLQNGDAVQNGETQEDGVEEMPVEDGEGVAQPETEERPEENGDESTESEEE